METRLQLPPTIVDDLNIYCAEKYLSAYNHMFLMPAGVGDLSPAGAGQLLLGVAAPGGCRPEAGALPPQHLPLHTGQI